MPIIQSTNLNQNTVLAVWKITETRGELLTLFNGQFTDAGLNQHDNLHWLASRLLIQQLFQGSFVLLTKDAFNKPSLIVNEEPYFISITHSFAYAAVMVSKETPVAIDMERVDERVVRVSRKFIRADEQYEGKDIAQRYTLIWSAKETLYKLHGTKELDFKEHLRIQVVSDTAVQGEILKAGAESSAVIEVGWMDDYIITYNQID
jgi:phosphopantetheinyl transferase